MVYFIENENEQCFSTLRAIRTHLELMSDNDRKSYDGSHILMNKNGYTAVKHEISIKKNNKVVFKRINYFKL